MGKKKEKWKTLSSEEVFSTPWMSIYHNLFEMNNGERGNYFFLHTGGGALFLAVKNEGENLLVKRYRDLFDGDRKSGLGGKRVNIRGGPFI